MTHIMNLSNVPLTEDEIAILEKGLLFIPTPTGNLRPLEKPIEQYKRTIRLDYSLQDNTQQPNPFKKKSNYNPTTSNNPSLEKYLKMTETEIMTHCNKPHFKITDNLTVQERKAIKLLKQRKEEIIIKKS